MPRIVMCAGCYLAKAGNPKAVAGYYQNYAVFKAMNVIATAKRPESTVSAR